MPVLGARSDTIIQVFSLIEYICFFLFFLPVLGFSREVEVIDYIFETLFIYCLSNRIYFFKIYLSSIYLYIII